jgi:hypothetical protein
MLTFEQAKGLKKGDIVYGDGYKCYVVKVTLNEKDQSAEVVYTDGGAGGDEFTSRTNDPRLSLTRQAT